MKQFKKPSLYRPIIKELSNQQNPGNYNFFFHIYIYINLIFFLDSHISSLQAITLNEYDSALETKDSVKNITENESVPITTQITNYKTVKELIDISPNSIKSLENIQHATNFQELLIKKDFLNEMKSVFNSETFKIISNNKTVSNNKSTENNDINNSNIQQESQIFISPKHNKSVLKSTTGSTNSLIKKRVIFDLTNKKDKESYSDDDKEKKELCENNWNTLGYVKINDIFL